MFCILCELLECCIMSDVRSSCVSGTVRCPKRHAHVAKNARSSFNRRTVELENTRHCHGQRRRGTALCFSSCPALLGRIWPACLPVCRPHTSLMHAHSKPHTHPMQRSSMKSREKRLCIKMFEEHRGGHVVEGREIGGREQWRGRRYHGPGRGLVAGVAVL